MSQTVDRILADFDQAASERGFWESHWEDISRFVMPNRSFTSTHAPGSERHRPIWDDTAVEDADRLASALSGMLTNPAIVWFNLRVGQEALNHDRDARLWLREARDIALATFNSSLTGFNMSIQELYQDLVGFGTGALFSQSVPGRGLIYQARPLGEIYLREDAYGLVNSVYRLFTLSLRQAVEHFGLEALSDASRRKFLDGKLNEKISILHAVAPREDRNYQRLDAKNKPWASFYIEKEQKHALREGGFDEFPFLTPRWIKYSGEVYGRSPAMKALPSVRMANAMMKTVITGAQKVVDPPMQMPDDGFLGPLRNQPGGVNFYRAGTQDRAEPLISGANPGLGWDILSGMSERIGRAFFRDMLELPMLDRMTAQEVMQRQQERMQLLAPALMRLQGELLGPLITRTLGMLSRRGELPPAPDSLRGQLMTVEYVSPLATSQKASEAGAIQQWMALMAPFAQVDPNAMLVVDSGRVARLGAELFQVHPGLTRSEREVEQILEQQQAEQEALISSQVGESAASAAKDMASAMGGSP